MAVIGPKEFAKLAISAIALCTTLYADRAADVRAQLGHVASALTAGDPADAMAPFDKSFAEYDKLKGYFQGLTGFQIENEINVLDEQDTDTSAELAANWTLTLANPATKSTEHRSSDVNLRLALKGGKWKIVDFAPVELFNPLRKPPSSP
jgi:hypothetical protein